MKPLLPARVCRGSFALKMMSQILDTRAGAVVDETKLEELLAQDGMLGEAAFAVAWQVSSGVRQQLIADSTLRGKWVMVISTLCRPGQPLGQGETLAPASGASFVESLSQDALDLLVTEPGLLEAFVTDRRGLGWKGTNSNLVYAVSDTRR